MEHSQICNKISNLEAKVKLLRTGCLDLCCVVKMFLAKCYQLHYSPCHAGCSFISLSLSSQFQLSIAWNYLELIKLLYGNNQKISMAYNHKNLFFACPCGLTAPCSCHFGVQAQPLWVHGQFHGTEKEEMANHTVAPKSILEVIDISCLPIYVPSKSHDQARWQQGEGWRNDKEG